MTAGIQITDTTPVAEAAELYARMGLMPIPVYGVSQGRCTCRDFRCSKPGKHPIGKDWPKSATSNLDAVRDMFRTHRGNVGIYCGNQFVLIDADGDEGVANLASLGDLPATLTAISGSGKGRHLLYKLMPGQDPANITDRSSKVAKGIDIKIRGQFVAAPSTHISGGRYHWTALIEPAPLPDWLYEKIRKPTQPAPKPRLTVVREGSATIMDRLRRYIAKMPDAVSGQGGHAATFAVARKIAGNELSEAEEFELLREYNRRCQPPWSESDLEHKLRSAREQGQNVGLPDRPRPGRAAPPVPPMPTPPDPTQEPEASWEAWLLWEQTKRGVRLRRVGENAVVILQFDPRWAGKVRLDTFRQQITVTAPPWASYYDGRIGGDVWTEADTSRLQGWLTREYGLDLGIDPVHRAVMAAAEHGAHHSAAEWMNSLAWDGTARIDHWLCTYLGAPDTEYVHQVGRWWLISAAARALQPGCKADHVLILEGPQGTRKSSALRALAGPEWFSDTPIDLSSKDAFLAMAGRLIVELPELDSLRKADADRAKAFFTSAVDHYRPPYGRQMVSVPRSCVFAGTVNHGEYLKDQTGNRRYWPVACEHIALSAISRDRDQLWAEAVHAFKAGAPWYPTAAEEHATLGEEQDIRLIRDAWEDLVREWLMSNAVTETTVSNVMERGLQLPKAQWGRSEQMRIAVILARLGFLRKIVKREGVASRIYQRS